MRKPQVGDYYRDITGADDIIRITGLDALSVRFSPVYDPRDIWDGVKHIGRPMDYMYHYVYCPAYDTPLWKVINSHN